MKNTGFTLIELLVVVLIIGILASIALPQYQKAVDKSRGAEFLAAARAWINAQRVYYMGNGTFSADLDALDIQMPVMKNWTVRGTYGHSIGGSGEKRSISFTGKNTFEGIVMSVWVDSNHSSISCNYSGSGNANKCYALMSSWCARSYGSAKDVHCHEDFD